MYSSSSSLILASRALFDEGGKLLDNSSAFDNAGRVSIAKSFIAAHPIIRLFELGPDKIYGAGPPGTIKKKPLE